jgi:hypothetical protein
MKASRQCDPVDYFIRIHQHMRESNKHQSKDIDSSQFLHKGHTPEVHLQPVSQILYKKSLAAKTENLVYKKKGVGYKVDPESRSNFSTDYTSSGYDHCAIDNTANNLG